MKALTCLSGCIVFGLLCAALPLDTSTLQPNDFSSPSLLPKHTCPSSVQVLISFKRQQEAFCNALGCSMATIKSCTNDLFPRSVIISPKSILWMNLAPRRRVSGFKSTKSILRKSLARRASGIKSTKSILRTDLVPRSEIKSTKSILWMNLAPRASGIKSTKSTL